MLSLIQRLSTFGIQKKKKCLAWMSWHPCYSFRRLPTEPHTDKPATQLSPTLVSEAPPLENPEVRTLLETPRPQSDPKSPQVFSKVQMEPFGLI